MTLEQLTSAVYNNIVTGLKGTNVNVPIAHEHIEDSIVAERMLIIKEYMVKGLLPRKDLMVPIPCISLDCAPIEQCPSGCSSVVSEGSTNFLHFEVPPVIQDFGDEAFEYVGSKDRQNPFRVYTDQSFIYNKYRPRRSEKPFVWINMAPNSNGNYDGYVFNAPLMKDLTVVLIPKDPRHLSRYSCCPTEIDFFSFFAADVEKRVTEKFLRYYRQIQYVVTPSDNTVKP